MGMPQLVVTAVLVEGRNKVRLPPLHAGAYRIRHDRIDSDGKLTLRHNSRLHHIGDGPPLRRHQRLAF